MSDNPYQASDTPPLAPSTRGDAAASRQIPIRPLGRLSEAKTLIGDQYWLFVGICLVAMLIGSIVPFYVLFGPMLCGVHMCFDDRARGSKTNFERLFSGFDFFLPSFLAILVVVLTMLVVLMPIMILMFVGFFVILAAANGNEDFIAFAFGIGMLPSIILLSVISTVLYVPFLFIFALIVDQRMTAWEAVKTSWSGARKNFWGLCGMTILYVVIVVIGSIPCYLPTIFLLPLLFGAHYLVYRDIFPNASTPYPPQ